jgi:hypothetical protein
VWTVVNGRDQMAGGTMSETRDQDRSELPCPVCGEHRLALETPPQIDVMGVQPYTDLIAMGDVAVREPPAIVCLACGASWTDLQAFQQARQAG